MVKDLHDLATDVRHTSHTYSRYQTGLERVVLSTLEDYSGIIHTLPILVKLHEDAMEAFNYSKEKDSVRSGPAWFRCLILLFVLTFFHVFFFTFA